MNSLLIYFITSESIKTCKNFVNNFIKLQKTGNRYAKTIYNIIFDTRPNAERILSIFNAVNKSTLKEICPRENERFSNQSVFMPLFIVRIIRNILLYVPLLLSQLRYEVQKLDISYIHSLLWTLKSYIDPINKICTIGKTAVLLYFRLK